MAPRKRLGQLLTELGVVDEHQLQSALGHQKQWGGKLGAILVQKGFCSEENMVAALTKHLGIPRVRLAEVKVDPRALKCVSKAIAEKLHVLPYEVSGSGRSEVITVAMSDPTDLSSVDQLAFHTGKRIKPMLAGDTEIVAAIHTHYGGGEEKKDPTDKVARPGQPHAAGGAQGGPAGSVAGFPKRIEPTPAAAAPGAARGSPYIPPPIPTAKPAPVAAAQKLDEIEPDEAAPAAAEAAPPPALELPDIEGQEFGLEPIAAHSQFGDEVAGQEEVAGEGSAADQVEGLVSASLFHEGAAQARAMEGMEAIAREAAVAEAGSGWTGPILGSDVPSAAAGAWAEPGTAQTGWDVSAPAPAGGWAAEPAGAPSGWSIAPPNDWGAAENDSAQEWAAPEPGAPSDAPGEALPADAILGTAPILGPGDEGANDAATPREEAAPAAQGAVLEPPASEPPEDSGLAAETEAPDAWASTDDPLAAEASLPDPLAFAAAGEEAPANEASLPDPLDPEVQPDALAFDVPAASGDDGPAIHRGHGATNEFANPVAASADDADAADGGEAAQGWIGGALEGATPLSPADLGTLASIGVDPADGVGALRLLAVLVRILNRNQLIEPGDLREEIRESLNQAAAAPPSEPSNGLESHEGSAAEPGPAET